MCILLSWPPCFLPELLLGTGQTTRKGGRVPPEEKGFAMNSMEILAGTLRKTWVFLTARLNKVKDVVYFT